METVKVVTLFADPPIYNIENSANKHVADQYSGQNNAREPASCENLKNPSANPRSSNREVIFFCPPCCITFKARSDFDQHNEHAHNIKTAGGSRSSNNNLEPWKSLQNSQNCGTVSCNVCGTTFKRQDHLKRHIKSFHHHEKLSTCPVCKKFYASQDMLLQHINKEHMSDYEVFNCRICDFKCNSHAELEKHESDIHSAERHVCSYCNANFKRRDHMLRHVKSQHLNQSISCPICNQKYKRRDHVTRHIREKHKMGYVNNRLITSSDISLS